MKVIKRWLAERAEATAGRRGREHAVHAVRIVAYLTTVTGQKGDRIGAVRPRTVAGAKGLVRERTAGIVRTVRIAGADRVARVVLSAVAASPRVETGVLASGMLRLLLLLVFLGTITHCPKHNCIYSAFRDMRDYAHTIKPAAKKSLRSIINVIRYVSR